MVNRACPLLNDPDTSQAKLGNAIGRDPVIFAEILRHQETTVKEVDASSHLGLDVKRGPGPRPSIAWGA